MTYVNVNVNVNNLLAYGRMPARLSVQPAPQLGSTQQPGGRVAQSTCGTMQSTCGTMPACHACPLILPMLHPATPTTHHPRVSTTTHHVFTSVRPP